MVFPHDRLEETNGDEVVENEWLLIKLLLCKYSKYQVN